MSNLTLYLIRGLPGAGKTTFAQALYSTGLVAQICEADTFFGCNDSYKFDATKLNQAHLRCTRTADYALSEGHSIAVSNTSTTEKEVKVYQEIAEKYNAKFVSLIVENRHEGVNIHGVPEEKLRQMRFRFTTKL